MSSIDRQRQVPGGIWYLGISLEKEVTYAEDASLYNKLPENWKQYALSTDGSCHTAVKYVSEYLKWKTGIQNFKTSCRN